MRSRRAVRRGTRGSRSRPRAAAARLHARVVRVGRRPCARWPAASSRASRAAAARSARRVFIASVTDARTSSASRRTESVSSVSMPSRSPDAGGEFGAAGIGDLVDGLAAVGLLGDEALLFELRQARVDRARARHVGAAEAVAERLDELVAVHRALGEQAQQVEPQVPVREDGRAHARTARSTVDVAADRVDAQVGPALVELAPLAGDSGP